MVYIPNIPNNKQNRGKKSPLNWDSGKDDPVCMSVSALSLCYAFVTRGFFSDSDYSFAFNLAQTDEVFQHARDPMGNSVTSYLHNMKLYKQLSSKAFKVLAPKDTYPGYPGESWYILYLGVGMACLLVIGSLHQLSRSGPFLDSLYCLYE